MSVTLSEATVSNGSVISSAFLWLKFLSECISAPGSHKSCTLHMQGSKRRHIKSADFLHPKCGNMALPSNCPNSYKLTGFWNLLLLFSLPLKKWRALDCLEIEAEWIETSEAGDQSLAKEHLNSTKHSEQNPKLASMAIALCTVFTLLTSSLAKFWNLYKEKFLNKAQHDFKFLSNVD